MAVSCAPVPDDCNPTRTYAGDEVDCAGVEGAVRIIGSRSHMATCICICICNCCILLLLLLPPPPPPPPPLLLTTMMTLSLPTTDRRRHIRAVVRSGRLPLRSDR